MKNYPGKKKNPAKVSSRFVKLDDYLMSAERFEVCLWNFSQADRARDFGARVYCVGVMDFDHKQVGEGGQIVQTSCWVAVCLSDCVLLLCPDSQ